MGLFYLARAPYGPARLAAEVNDTLAAKFIGKIVKWIPADWMVIYTGIVKGVDDSASAWNLWATIAFTVLAPIIVLLLAFASGTGASPVLWLRAALAAPAFLIWSAIVPNSVWEQVGLIGEKPALAAGIVAAIGFVFSLVADGLEKRVAP
jgi:hypothetical protein